MVRHRSKNRARTRKNIKYPPQIDAALQHAINLHKMGALNEAESIYRKILTEYPQHADANHLIGVCCYAKKDFQSAMAFISAGLRESPHNAEFMHNLALVYKDSNRPEEAKKLLKSAIKENASYSSAYNSLGSIYLQEGNVANSVVQFKKAVKLDPGSQDAIYNLSQANIKSKDYEKAIPLLASLHKLNPFDINIAISLSDCYQHQASIEKATGILIETYNQHADDTEIIYKLAEIYEKSSDLDAAQEWIEKARDMDKENEKCIYLNAVILRRKKLFDEAVQQLSLIKMPLNDNSLSQKIYFELGRLYDRKGKYDLAFENYTLGNTLQDKTYNKALIDKDRFISHINKVTDNLDVKWIERWDSCNELIDERRITFMVAFPRSGTTLLDQILDGHSGIQVMEEKPILGEIIEQLVAKNSDYPRLIEDLTCKDISKYRKYYLKEIEKYLDLREGAMLVDKLPLNIVEIELIYRLFPGSKIILSLRHPYDVCLSNFMQHYDLNDAMANFLSLENTAITYDMVMGLWRKYVSIMPIQHHSVKYEDLVKNAEKEAKQIIEFLELGWEETVLDFVQHAKMRKINTPSYQQVTENIYTRSRYRWKHYERYIEPIKSILKPQLKYFGYSE